MTMTFKLLNSLVNPPAAPVVEADQPTEQPQANSEHIEVLDCEQLEGPNETGSEGESAVVEYKYNVHVNYFHPALHEDGMLVIVTANLKGYYSVEDDRFSAPYGSTTAHGGSVYGVYDQFEWSDVQIPQIEDNIEVYKLPPEQSQHVIQFIIHAMSKMDHDAIDRLVGGEDLTSEIEAKYKRQRDNDYEPPEPDFDY